tara:strand:- start:20636 stop:20779 length:144 start_codon:yes stop_codon:yes gene_type:complete
LKGNLDEIRLKSTLFGMRVVSSSPDASNSNAENRMGLIKVHSFNQGD